MASICEPCALRLSRAANQAKPTSPRAFSTSNIHGKSAAIPAFQETSHSELNKVLSALRNKHFIPAYLYPSERRLIFGSKNRQLLIDNPRSIEIGGEEIPLKPIDRNSQLPNRKRLVETALKLLKRKGESRDWQILPQLLTGLAKANSTPKPAMMEKIVRSAVESGHLGIIIICLQKSAETGLTLRDPVIRRHVLWGVRSIAESDDWSKEATLKALKDANQIAMLMETQQHGGGDGFNIAKDPRAKAFTIGVFLELAAVHAYKHQGGQDKDGMVKAYMQRLMNSAIYTVLPRDTIEPGPQYEIMGKLPIYHGYSLAKKILPEGSYTTSSTGAEKIQEYEAALQQRIRAIEATNPAPGGYGDQVVTAWNKMLR
ncbi:hypothetical protein K431DRAFT_300117 [Polychaeton citri CBS 116435]|uniref:Uncharacterized protein n=1 Tax=Polychaeton citri CBS 116435 TaxID=1314669 RepID=A0A9P4QDF1_9PEZI|nr:hypothetical protein K431DRAFT_300117 [Polychaeton citri CBS 116435]